MTDKELRKLLSEMSLDEKLGELQQIPGQFFRNEPNPAGADLGFNYPEETVRCIGSSIDTQGADFIKQVQKEHMENHPHHIPMLFVLDIIHGYHTTFPSPIAQACSFEPELVKELASATAKESSANGLHVTLSPSLDLVRDPRWGRVTETPGEDTYLNSVMAKAIVEGYQGDDLSKEGTISACVKHFAAYGAVEGGREYGTVDVSERNLRQYYLPPYKAAVDAGAGMVMCGFNAIAGIPASADKHILREILRDEWGYKGAVISDYGSINNMNSHGISDDNAVLSKFAIEAGIDIEMCINRYVTGLPKLLETGEISMDLIDEAVYRVLNLKNRLGLFENPYRFADQEKANEINRCKEFLDLGRKAVPKCSVLLKNEEKILPLDASKKIAFIGPFLNHTDFRGAWGGKLYVDTKIQDEITERFPKAKFTFTDGCKMIGKEQPEIEFYQYKEDVYESDPVARKKKIAAAAKAAKKADVAVLFIGEHPDSGGELSSKAFLEIPQIQQELFDAVSAANPNTVVVFFNHRPLDIRKISAGSKAVLDVWYGGTMTAEGVVDMLFGDVAPSGRLTMSFPRTVGQCPIYYNMLPTDHSPLLLEHYVTGYIDCPLDPLYSFGEGLTYTDFEYSDFKLSKEAIGEGESLIASVTVKNVGERAGYETVQMYIRDSWCSISRPTKELKGFEKIWLEAGESKTVEFTITPETCMFYNVDLEHVWEPGEIQVFVGPNSKVSNPKTFELK